MTPAKSGLVQKSGALIHVRSDDMVIEPLRKMRANRVRSVLVMVGWFIRSQVRNNTEQLTILRNATSPAAQAAQAQQTQKVVKQIDCDGQKNNQRVLVSVKAIVPNIQVPELDPVCQQIFSSTTTTP